MGGILTTEDINNINIQLMGEPYHIWGDTWEHWDELYKAEHFIIKYVYKYSKCRLISKEKYGSIRYEHLSPPWSNKLRIKFPFWKKKIGNEYYPRWLLFWDTCWLYRQWYNFGIYILKKAVKKACIKFPNVKEEITNDLWTILD